VKQHKALIKLVRRAT